MPDGALWKGNLELIDPGHQFPGTCLGQTRGLPSSRQAPSCPTLEVFPTGIWYRGATGTDSYVAEVNIQLTASTAGRLFFNLSTHQDVTDGQNFAVSWNMTNCNAFGY